MPPEVAISVVIPCRNGAETLPLQLQALSQQRISSPWEIVVADNGSTDGTRSIAESFHIDGVPVRVVDASETPGINRARNYGIRGATGHYVAMCDCDDIVSPQWLATILATFEQGADIVAGALQRVDGSGRHLGPVIGLVGGLNFLPWPHGGNCAFPRHMYETLGGFDESYAGGGDETDFFWRAQLAGYQVRESLESLVFYRQRDTAARAFRQHFRFGLSHVQLYAGFRSQGMPRPSPATSMRGWVRAAKFLALSMVKPRLRIRAARECGLVAGRLAGSARLRTLFL